MVTGVAVLAVLTTEFITGVAVLVRTCRGWGTVVLVMVLVETCWGWGWGWVAILLVTILLVTVLLDPPILREKGVNCSDWTWESLVSAIDDDWMLRITKLSNKAVVILNIFELIFYEF